MCSREDDPSMHDKIEAPTEDGRAHDHVHLWAKHSCNGESYCTVCNRWQSDLRAEFKHSEVRRAYSIYSDEWDTLAEAVELDPIIRADSDVIREMAWAVVQRGVTIEDVQAYVDDTEQAFFDEVVGPAIDALERRVRLHRLAKGGVE